MKIPKHVAIILDGNGRWAKKRGMPRNYGHTMGAKNVEVICKAAHDLGEDAQGDAGDPEAGRRGARPVRGHTRALGTGETAVDETGEEVLRAPVRIGESAPANCLLTTYRSVGFEAEIRVVLGGFTFFPALPKIA